MLVVCVTGTTPSITNLGGAWQVQRNTVANAIACGLFFMPNNPGGITAVAVTLGGTLGGATATILEFQFMPANGPFIETSSAATSAGSATPATSTSNLSTQVLQLNELVFGCAFFAAATVNSNANSAELLNSCATGVSTSGAPNAQTQGYWGSGDSNAINSMVVNLSASVAWQAIVFRTLSSGGQVQTWVQENGIHGTVWPPYYQGIIGIG